YRSPRPPCCRKKSKVAGFYAARSRTIPPPPWTNFAPPFSLLLIILGLFLEGIAMILIVLPVLLPSLGVNGIDPIWFGIFFVLMIELALISPPVGMNLFVIQSVARSELREVIIGVIPYALIMLASVAVIYAFPGIVLWLPFAG
ncbi:TRAP transporter large permease subunit, partial [Salipiger thiooxidans]|uniref:TRAP transporter large permease subunit n=1 Tax=Salipiger thiooxidans TaxID=282683 RepID=UPI001CF99CE6